MWNRAVRQLLLIDDRHVVVNFVTHNRASLHAQTPQVWMTAMIRFADAAGECMNVGNFIAMAETFAIVEREFIDVKKQDQKKNNELDAWMSKMKLVFGKALTDQINLSVIEIEDMPDPSSR